MKIKLNLSDNKMRTARWLLGRRYGGRKSIETLILMAVQEAVRAEAEKTITEEGYHVE